MSENGNKGLFGLHGISGILILTVGLLIILTGLITLAIKTQQDGARKPYDPTAIRDLNNLKKSSYKNANFAFIDAKVKEK